MGKKLESFVNKSFKKEFLDIKDNSLISLDEVYEISKKQLILEIEDEIKKEYETEIRNEAISKAKKYIEQAKISTRIKELKSMMVIGIIVAFLVGLSVNQLTEMILFLKKDFSVDTWWFSLIIALIIVVIIGIIIFKKIYSAMDSITNE